MSYFDEEDPSDARRVFIGDRFDSSRSVSETARLIRSEIRAAEAAGTLQAARWRITVHDDGVQKPRITVWGLDSQANDPRFQAVKAIVNRYNQRLGMAFDDDSALYLAFEVWHMRSLEK